MKIYGSEASPFVRRLRVLFFDNHEFIPTSVFELEDREVLKKKNPCMKIPFIESDEGVLFDSSLIWRHYNKKNHWADLDLSQEKYQQIINETNDSGVTLFLRKRMGEDPEQTSRFTMLQKERIELCLSHLDNNIHLADKLWNPLGLWLYCLLDWFDYREIYPFQKFESLKKFWKENQERAEIKATDPRANS